MSTVHWQRVTELFAQASALPRDMHIEFLRRSCPNDPELQREVLSLMEHDETAPPDFLQTADGQPAGKQSEPIWPEPYVGLQIDKYHIRRVIATGGMGTVYEAEQERPQRLVGIKLMHAGAYSSSARRRFEFECQALGRLTHPNIAQIYDAGHWRPEGSDQELPYFAMEYVPGAKSIINYSAGQRLGTHDRVRLFLQICDAVNYGHQRGIIHRDLKPANMLVDATGKAKVIDFGVARATDADVVATTMQTDVGELVGTLYYMSPEQCEGDPLAIDVRSDVYSLGVVLFQLLTGQLPYPFRGTSIYHTTRMIREDTPTRPSAVLPALRGDLETILLKAMDKEKDRRYQSVAELASDLQRYLKNEPILARKPGTIHQWRLLVRRNKRLTVALLALAAVLISATIISSILAIRSSESQVRAENSEYEASLSATLASIQRYDVADARKRLENAARMRLGMGGKSWELCYLRSLLDQSITRTSIWSDPIRQMSMNSSATLIALMNHASREVQIRSIGYVNGMPTIGVPEVVPLPGEKGMKSVESILLAGDGRWLAVGTNVGSIYLAELSDALKRGTFSTVPTSLRAVDRLAANNAGTLLAACDGGNGDLEVWDIAILNQPQRILYSKDFSTLSLAFSKSGNFLALGGNDHIVRLLDVKADANPKLVAELHGHTHKVTDVSFRPDEEVLASSSLDGTVRLWDVSESIQGRSSFGDAAIGVNRGILQTDGQGIMTVAFSPEGTVLATGGLDNTIRLWNVDEHRKIRSYSDPNQTWEISAQQEYAVLRGHEEQISGISFAPTGDWLVSAAWNGDLRVFGTGEQRDVPTLIGHKSSVMGAVFDPSGNWLISGGGDSAFFIWDVHAAEAVRGFYGHDSDIRAMSLSDDGAFLAAVDGDGTLGVWQFDDTRQSLHQVSKLRAGERWAQAVAWSKGHHRLAAGSRNGDVCVWSFDDPESPALVFEQKGASESVWSLAFLDFSGNLLAVASGSDPFADVLQTGSLGTWNVQTGMKAAETSTYHHSVTSLAIDAECKQLAVGLGDGTLDLWDIHTPLSPRKIWEQRLHTSAVLSLAFQHGGIRLASGSRDRTARVWDVSSGSELLVLRDHPGSVTNVNFSPDGLTLATCSSGQWGADNSVKLWEAHPQSLDRDRVRRLRSQAARARSTAKADVDQLFAQRVCKESVLNAINETNSRVPAVTNAATRLAESRIANLESWQQLLNTVLSKASPKDALERALMESECVLAEISRTHAIAGYLRLAKGMALYRLGKFDAASEALGDSATAFQQRVDDSRFPDASKYLVAANAAQAMCCYQLGMPDDARRLFDAARALRAREPEQSLQDLAALFEEAEALIEK